MTLFSEFKNNIISKDLISDEDRILIAVSGGVDSMVLLDMLSRLRKDNKLQLSAIHVQHHLRSDAEEDAFLVKSFCEENEINFHRVDLNPELKLKNQSIEAWARTERYSHFNELKEKIGADIIMTAHHGDDQVETILMHISEGSGLDGLRGIREKIKNTIRPLLPFSKIEIQDYAKSKNIPFRQDSTNTDISHPRNFLRHEVIPNWKKQNPNLHSSVQQFTKNINEISDILDYTLNTLAKRVVGETDKGNIILKLDEFTDEPDVLKAHVLKHVLNDIQWRKYHWNNVNDLIEKGKTGSIIAIGDYEILKNRNTLIIQKNTVINNTHYKIHQGKKVESSFFTFDWQTKKKYVLNSNKDIEMVDAKSLLGSIELRPWKEGDYFQPLGMKGHKKISDYLTDIKMDSFSKNSQYVIALNDEVYWVCGQRISDKIKITPESTQFAELSFTSTVG